jgi:hypothetical protein
MRKWKTFMEDCVLLKKNTVKEGNMTVLIIAAFAVGVLICKMFN